MLQRFARPTKTRRCDLGKIPTRWPTIGVPPDLHDVFKRSNLHSGAAATGAEVRKVVVAGKGMMPSFAGRFNEEQMAAVIAYLHTGLK